MGDPSLEVRPHPIFGDAGINSALDKALLTVPDGHHVAFVAHVDLTGARITVMSKLGDKWSFSGFLDKQYTGTLTAAAELRFSA